jgi:hypothetical protein
LVTHFLHESLAFQCYLVLPHMLSFFSLLLAGY